jgi:hypothetical protein
MMSDESRKALNTNYTNEYTNFSNFINPNWCHSYLIRLIRVSLANVKKYNLFGCIMG